MLSPSLLSSLVGEFSWRCGGDGRNKVSTFWVQVEFES
jgi:hypothetical protein